MRVVVKSLQSADRIIRLFYSSFVKDTNAYIQALYRTSQVVFQDFPWCVFHDFPRPYMACLSTSFILTRSTLPSWHNDRSQWSSSSMSDCSVRGHGIESRCGQLCLSHNHCDLQPWARAVCTFPAVPRSTQPSTLHGMVNEYQLSGFYMFFF